MYNPAIYRSLEIASSLTKRMEVYPKRAEFYPSFHYKRLPHVYLVYLRKDVMMKGISYLKDRNFGMMEDFLRLAFIMIEDEEDATIWKDQWLDVMTISRNEEALAAFLEDREIPEDEDEDEDEDGVEDE